MHVETRRSGAIVASLSAHDRGVAESAMLRVARRRPQVKVHLTLVLVVQAGVTAGDVVCLICRILIVRHEGLTIGASAAIL